MKKIPKIMLVLFTVSTLLQLTGCQNNRITETEIKNSIEEATQLHI